MGGNLLNRHDRLSIAQEKLKARQDVFGDTLKMFVLVEPSDLRDTQTAATETATSLNCRIEPARLEDEYLYLPGGAFKDGDFKIVFSAGWHRSFEDKDGQPKANRFEIRKYGETEWTKVKSQSKNSTRIKDEIVVIMRRHGT